MNTPNIPQEKCRVLLVEDHPMFRERLAHLINKDLGMIVCGETDNIHDALDLVQREHPDIAIVDISLRGASGLELLKNLRAMDVSLPVLVLSMHEENLFAERALRAGARGYIMKSEASAEIIKAIQAVHCGDVYVSPSINKRILSRVAQPHGTKTPRGVESLTDRELEVFHLIGTGRGTREIAASLHLGESTVETYRARIKDKLGLRNVAELYQRAVQWTTEQQLGGTK